MLCSEVLREITEKPEMVAEFMEKFGFSWSHPHGSCFLHIRVFPASDFLHGINNAGKGNKEVLMSRTIKTASVKVCDEGG